MTLELDVKANAFRVLGLETNVPLSAAIGRRDELVAHIGIDKVLPYPSDYAIFAPPERTLETVAAAVQRLEDPRTRLLDEATWFHLRDSIDAFAASTLSDGNSPQARALWEGAVDQATDPVIRQHYQHNLAVLHLCTAEIPVQSLRSPRKTWDRVLTAWTALLRSSTFWRQLADESPASRDTRFQPETPTEVRTSIGLKLAQECSRRAAEALAEGRTEDAWDWATAPTTNQLPAEFTAHAEEEVIEAVAHFIRTKLEPVQDNLREAEKRSVNVKQIEPNVLLARNTFEQFRPLGAKASPALLTTADLIADTLRQLGIHYNNTIKDYAKALQTTKDAFQFVASEGLRVILQQHMRIYQWNIAQAAFEAAKEASDYDQALTAFEDLERYADPAKAAEALDHFRDSLKDLLLKKELRKLRWENAVLRFEPAAEAGDYEQALAIYEDLERYVDPAEGQKALDPFRSALEDLRVVHEGKPIQPFLSFLRAPSPPHSAAQEPERGWTPSLTPATGIVILLAVVTIGLALPRYFVSQPNSPSQTTSAPPTQPAEALGQENSPKKADAPERQSERLPQDMPTTESPDSIPPKVTPSAPSTEGLIARPSLPSSDRRALRAEIERRRLLLMRRDAALKAEQLWIAREQAALDDLSAEIRARYASGPNGIPPEVYARQRAEFPDYEGRIQRFHARREAYTNHSAALKRAIAEFQALVDEYSESR